MNIFLLTHTDLDGIGCYITMKRLYPNATIIPTYSENKDVNKNVDRILGLLNEDDYFFITDLSPSEGKAKEIDEHKYASNIRLLDHHKTALELNRYDWATVEIEDEDGTLQCGTSLTLFYGIDSLEKNIEEIAKHSFIKFIELVRLWDTWDWNRLGIPEAKNLNMLLHTYGREAFVANILSKLDQHLDLFDDIDNTVINIKTREEQDLIDKKDRSIISIKYKHYTLGVVFADSNLSVLGNELANRHLEYDAIAMVTGHTVSLRTVKDNVDVSDIAKTFGGGGHKPAAGFVISNDIKQQFISSIFGGED